MSISLADQQLLLSMREARRILDKCGAEPTERYFYNTMPLEEYLNYPAGVTALEVEKLTEDFEWIQSLCDRTKNKRRRML